MHVVLHHGNGFKVYKSLQGRFNYRILLTKLEPEVFECHECNFVRIFFML